MVAARLVRLMLLGLGRRVITKRIERIGCAAGLARLRRGGCAAATALGTYRLFDRLRRGVSRVFNGLSAFIRDRCSLGGGTAARTAWHLGRLVGFAGSGTAVRARRLARGLILIGGRSLALSRSLSLVPLRSRRRGQCVHRLRRGQCGGRLLEERAVLLHFELHRGAGGTGPAHHAAACTAAARCGRLLVG